jgi:hypothetical protein
MNEKDFTIVPTVYVQETIGYRFCTHSLACGKVMPVKDGDNVSVYISQPVP